MFSNTGGQFKIEYYDKNCKSVHFYKQILGAFYFTAINRYDVKKMIPVIFYIYHRQKLDQLGYFIL